jgi:hypothetical protein
MKRIRLQWYRKQWLSKLCRKYLPDQPILRKSEKALRHHRGGGYVEIYGCLRNEKGFAHYSSSMLCNTTPEKS